MLQTWPSTWKRKDLLRSKVCPPWFSGPVSPPASSVPREMRVREGSVLVFIDDRASGRLIWRGTVTAETRRGSTEQGVHLLTQMAHEIAKEVPAHVGAQK